MTAIRLNTVKVARQCACKGWLIGSENPRDENADAVTKHQESEPHRSWNRDSWIEANTTTQPVRTVLRRVDAA